MDKRKKIIIDTDIGDEIDDAMAIYFAMKQSCDIIGITTVFQNTVERARIAKKLIKLFGNGYDKIPVFAGYGTPICEEDRIYPHTCQYSPDLDDESFAPDAIDPDVAVDFIIESCKKWGKDLTVVCLGPFTNVAKVIEKDRAALSLAESVTIMGGAYFRQYADWNVSCDVNAADVMFRELDNLECMGADVTHTLPIGQENYKKLLEMSGRGGSEDYIAKLLELWQLENPSRCPVLHDPLVIEYIIDPSLCNMENHHIAVVTSGAAKGMTLNTDEYTKAYMNPFYRDCNLKRTASVARSVRSQDAIDVFMASFE